jgi:hypothetical protein
VKVCFVIKPELEVNQALLPDRYPPELVCPKNMMQFCAVLCLLQDLGVEVHLANSQSQCIFCYDGMAIFDMQFRDSSFVIAELTIIVFC